MSVVTEIEPTLVSLDQAAKSVEFDGWASARCASPLAVASIRAHALTLDQLHKRTHPVDPLALLLADVAEALENDVIPGKLRAGSIDPPAVRAIAILRNFIEGRQPNSASPEDNAPAALVPAEPIISVALADELIEKLQRAATPVAPKPAATPPAPPIAGAIKPAPRVIAKVAPPIIARQIAPKPITRVIPTPSPPAKRAPVTALTPKPVNRFVPDADGKAFCGQCDLRVKITKAALCTSKFCKVKPA